MLLSKGDSQMKNMRVTAFPDTPPDVGVSTDDVGNSIEENINIMLSINDWVSQGLSEAVDDFDRWGYVHSGVLDRMQTSIRLLSANLAKLEELSKAKNQPDPKRDFDYNE
jgi:hypothetical protein